MLWVNKISFKEQTTLLNKCIAKELDLSLELQKLGLTYDHLRYKEYAEGNASNAEFKSIEEYKVASKGIPAISFFSGAGGLDIGFDYAGFKNLASVPTSNSLDLCGFNSGFFKVVADPKIPICPPKIPAGAYVPTNW